MLLNHIIDFGSLTLKLHGGFSNFGGDNFCVSETQFLHM